MLDTTTGGPTVAPLAAAPDEVAELIASVIRDTYPAGIVDRVVAKTLGDGRIARLMGERAWFGARIDGTLVGVAAVHLRDEDTAYLSCHFVAARGRGVGTALTAARLDWARAAGASRAVATTHPWNTASQANLARFGFTAGARTPDAWVGEGEILELTAQL